LLEGSRGSSQKTLPEDIDDEAEKDERAAGHLEHGDVLAQEQCACQPAVLDLGRPRNARARFFGRGMLGVPGSAASHKKTLPAC